MAALALSYAPLAIAGAQEPLVLQRLTGPVTLDGRSDEPAWQEVIPLPLAQQSPDYGAPPSERTEVRVAYDDDYLYVAGKMYDDPAGMQGPSLKRDQLSPDNDYLGIILDTFRDNENAVGFFTTPAGIRLDLTVYNDAEGDLSRGEVPLSESWNTFWDVAAVRSDDGWFAEIRIPFSSLRFEDRDGRVVMGLIAWRWIARKGEVDIFPVYEPLWGGMSPFKPSQTADVVLEGIRSRRSLYLTPYVLGGAGFTNELNDPETAYEHDRDRTGEFGLDLKYGLTSNLTADITVNTDFAQVEADDQQANLTRYSLFFPEKRQFFLERSSAFEVPMGGRNNLFYSRRIGLYEGRQIPILGGMRVVGRIGAWDVGLLDMQTGKDEELPRENFGVLRLRRRVINPYSYLGAILTSRYGADGSYNRLYGIDGIFRVAGDDYISLLWAQSFEDGSQNRVTTQDPARLRFLWERRGREGLFYTLDLARAGRDFDPGIGFDTREDFSSVRPMIGYGWLAPADSPLSQYNLSLGGEAYWRNEGSVLESAVLGTTLNAFYNNYASLIVAVNVYHEDLDESFDLFDTIEVPVGAYDFFGAEFAYGAGGDLIAADLSLNGGTFYDGTRFSAGIRPRWSVSPQLNLLGYLEVNRIAFDERDEALTAVIARLRVVATLTTAFSVATFVQYNNASDVLIGNLRMRYNPREGVDLYLVYNEGLYTDRFNHIPVQPHHGDRTLLVKYAYTFLF